MTDTTPNYTPGDVANNHILGEDGTWHALPPTGPAPEQPKKKGKFWKIAGVATVAIIGISALANAGGGDDKADADQPSHDRAPAASHQQRKAKADKPSTAPAEQPTADYDVAVNAGKLIKDFEDNELAADQTYKDKTLKVTGVVDKIDTEIFDDNNYVLDLTNGSQYAFLSVSVHDMSQDELSTIKKGQTVTVIADFDDGGDLGVDLKHGHLA